MPLRCIAIDDEPLALTIIKTYAARIPELELVQTFDDAVSAAEFLKSSPVDLLFLDINMPDITGLDLVRALEIKPMIIFTTAYKQYAYDGFELEALDYLLKPINMNRFARAVQKALDYRSYQQQSQESESEALFVYSEYKLVKVDLREVEYIESLEDYIKIHLKHEKPILTLMTMKKVLEKLPAGKFRRIHRSYIVPVAKVKAIVNRKVQLSSGKELPVSDTYADFLKEWGKL
ncbi:LytTR family DNA-binding domain-containing protein [Pontibacter sp. SGAir0037]|uniref:LytR/AlgR family response regulator transcription factor n=1 Tax=Pontibacter sp. SGAir0037 TaxID=2571030 RepID=UPI0010CD3F7C|nr:LytTR family DNA-binding domain-containing protein [Pontibacter sp. SGAir0037]QCR24991.1 DNA-binding response regulator [Pontibacter sp. SGAir0037]